MGVGECGRGPALAVQPVTRRSRHCSRVGPDEARRDGTGALSMRSMYSLRTSWVRSSAAERRTGRAGLDPLRSEIFTDDVRNIERWIGLMADEKPYGPTMQIGVQT